MASPLVSCDTFVVLPPLTADSVVIFGKNSDRPQDEVQQVVHFPAAKHPDGARLQCTYVEVDQATETFAVVLSKPSWMWGAEMGSNEHGLSIGNEGVYSKETDRLGKEKLLEPALLGMDLVRLGLERGRTAAEALVVICELLEKHGQGGRCAEDKDNDLAYHNSFLLADAREAWVLETVGSHWAAEQVTAGLRNLSNCLSIGAEPTKCSAGLKQHALDQGWWDGKESFDFARIFARQPEGRERLDAGRRLLEKHSDGGKFDIFAMLEILRDCESGICRPKSDPFPTQAAQVSVLRERLSSHWFTGTPDPRHSVFKPIVFTGQLRLGRRCSEPVPADAGGAAVGWKHQLYAKHERCYETLLAGAGEMGETLRQLERDCVLELQTKLGQEGVDEADLQLAELFEDAVEAELRFYK